MSWFVRKILEAAESPTPEPSPAPSRSGSPRRPGGRRPPDSPVRFGLDELARRSGVPIAELKAAAPAYRSVRVPKRSGGERTLRVPDPATKAIQRHLLHGVLDRVPIHPAAHGFESGRSIVTNALPHAGKAVVIRMDLVDFFDSTSARRVRRLFRVLGWDAESAALLTRLTTDGGTLPQGAPTSPRLANLVNVRLDARLSALAISLGGTYTRYADDLTFSFAEADHAVLADLLPATKKIVRQRGLLAAPGPETAGPSPPSPTDGHRLGGQRSGRPATVAASVASRGRAPRLRGQGGVADARSTRRLAGDRVDDRPPASRARDLTATPAATIALMPDGSLDASPGVDPAGPRLTVLIPSFNSAKTIERSLASVLDEDSVPFECIVIDDGSTDESADLVQAVADRDDRVILSRLPANAGVSNARNHGLAMARGEWIAFHDADDRMKPGWLPALMGPTRDPDVLVVVGQRVWSDGETEWVSTRYDVPDIREAGRKSIATHPLLLYYVSATGKAFHRSLLGDLRFEGRVMGDQAWTARAMLRAGDHIQVIEDTIFEWSRPTPGGSVETITTLARGSASGATRMAVMARTVFEAVSEEVDLQIDDEATRLLIKQAYFDRLLRSDLAIPMRDAVEQRDPDVEGLFDALTSFLDAVPRPVLASSEYLPLILLRPPAKRWSMLGSAARKGYWRMVRRALRADPRMARRIAWRRAVQPAFVFARVGPPLGPAVAGAVVSSIGSGPPPDRSRSD